MGDAAIELAGQLPEGCHVVAVTPLREALSVFHAALTPALRRKIFPHKEAPPALPFAKQVFDLAWACADVTPLCQPKAVIERVFQSLRPGGRLYIVTPLAGSFATLRQAFNTGQTHVGISALGAPTSLDEPVMQTADAWVAMAMQAGAARAHVREFAIDIAIKKPIAQDRLFAVHLLPYWCDGDLAAASGWLQAIDPQVESIHIKMGCVQPLKNGLEG